MIASLWANSNLDDGRNTRNQIIQDIEENYDEAVYQIMNPHLTQEDEIDKNNPFFSQMEKGIARLQSTRRTEGSVEQAIQQENDYLKYIDQ